MNQEEKLAYLQKLQQLKALKDEKRAMEVSQASDGRDVETALKTAADEFTLGYTPQIVGAFKSATSDKPYVEARDEYKRELELLKEANPVAAGVGTVGGIAGGLLVPAGAVGVLGKLGLRGARGAKALVSGGQAASKLARAGQAAKTGAKVGTVYGLLQNPGDVEGEVAPLQASQRAVGGLAGGLLGGAMGGATSLAGDVFAKGATKLREESGKQAFRTFKPGKAQAKEYMKKAKDIDIGEAALEEGIIGKIPRGKEKLLERVEERIQDVGKKIGSTLDDLSATEKQIRDAGGVVGVDKNAVAKELKSLIRTDETADPRFNDFVEKQVKAFLDAGEGRSHIDIKTAQDLKEKISRDLINWKGIKMNGPTEKDTYYLKLYQAMSDGVLDAADVLAEQSGKKSAKESIKAARKSYSNLKPMQKMLEDAVAAERSNRWWSPSDYITSTGGLIGGASLGGAEGAALGLLAGGANRLARKYGTQVAAQGFGAGAGLLERGSKKLQRAAPGLLPGYLGARSLRGGMNE